MIESLKDSIIIILMNRGEVATAERVQLVVDSAINDFKCSMICSTHTITHAK